MTPSRVDGRKERSRQAGSSGRNGRGQAGRRDDLRERPRRDRPRGARSGARAGMLHRPQPRPGGGRGHGGARGIRPRTLLPRPCPGSRHDRLSPRDHEGSGARRGARPRQDVLGEHARDARAGGDAEQAPRPAAEGGGLPRCDRVLLHRHRRACPEPRRGKPPVARARRVSPARAGIRRLDGLRVARRPDEGDPGGARRHRAQPAPDLRQRDGAQARRRAGRQRRRRGDLCPLQAGRRGGVRLQAPGLLRDEPCRGRHPRSRGAALAGDLRPPRRLLRREPGVSRPDHRPLGAGAPVLRRLARLHPAAEGGGPVVLLPGVVAVLEGDRRRRRLRHRARAQARGREAAGRHQRLRAVGA